MFLYVVFLIIFLWLVLLSFIILRTRKHYLDLIKHTGKTQLDEILDSVIKNDKITEAEVTLIKKEVNKIKVNSDNYLNKVGLVKFSAFGKTAADQSTALAIVNKKKSGIMIDFIYTHDGIRVYLKRISEGKGEGYDLSKDEERALEDALKVR